MLNEPPSFKCTCTGGGEASLAGDPGWDNGTQDEQGDPRGELALRVEGSLRTFSALVQGL